MELGKGSSIIIMRWRNPQSRCVFLPLTTISPLYAVKRQINISYAVGNVANLVIGITIQLVIFMEVPKCLDLLWA